MKKKKKLGPKFTPGGYDLRVKRSFAGLGLFAGEDIPKGKCVIEYVGRTLAKGEDETSRSKYLFEIAKNITIDGPPRINKAGYINHRCAPNCEPEIRARRVFIFSTKNIKEGTELTYDYGEEYCLDHCVPCRCSAKRHLYDAKKQKLKEKKEQERAKKKSAKKSRK